MDQIRSDSIRKWKLYGDLNKKVQCKIVVVMLHKHGLTRSSFYFNFVDQFIYYYKLNETKTAKIDIYDLTL
jgi:hypothetical protein